MPNYKIFQDYPDSLRVKIFGVDSGNNTVPILTDASGKMSITGTVATSGSVEVSGPVAISGSVAVSGPVAISGSVAVSGPVAISGSVAVSGTVDSSGWVFNSGGSPLYVNLYNRNVLDSGPVTDHITPLTSGAISGVWDVLGFNSWTLAVKYSGDSGENVSVKLQMAAVSGDNNWVDDGGYAVFSGTNAYWIFRTPTYHVRYARLYALNEASGGSGDLVVYMQAEY